ncbi:DNA-binding transcriptional regulator, MarR family [Sporobacter termitidis DSM 10068]|uniref:DNA-binding transcriptional regulator, MarR family n=1 Tax=Sporobacter termitidis DSM 10068 TaxID=1123282 RepID=A0A1M5U6U8_9FIRM|nr:MarR family winged helix-turn-helix transcriptional regulator [Sporobacter termitidis]SHH58772.1 DNA-binding transcriptional regulator, MarR family [Sporobacter termitidis DSM 10068]
MDYGELATEMLKKTGAMMKSSFWPKKASAFMHGEMFILNFLGYRDRDTLPSELSAAMSTSSARVAMALKSLEAKGFIERRVDKGDRRRILVTITELGRELVESERKEMHDKMVKILTELGEEDAREYIRIVGRITEISGKVFNTCC